MDIKKLKINLDILSKYLFVLSICVLIFGYGFVSSRNKLFPYYILDRAISQLETLKIKSVPHYLGFIRYNKSGVTIHNNARIMPGVTLITSFWSETDWTAGIRLIDLEGNILHHWEVKAKEIWPESPHNDLTKNAKNTNENFVHGTHLYPNGDIIFNIEYMGLVRMNSAGEVLWKLPYRTHHSVFHDEDGNLWVSGQKWVESGNNRTEKFSMLEVPYTEETMLNVSPDGKILQEISILESIYKGNYQHLLKHYHSLTEDLLHLNDIEVLSSKLAPQFPMFKSGDIVVSLKNISSIVVLDQSGNIKWFCSGIFTEQHDPDFEQNGWITVFDNRRGLGGRSMIRTINPVNNEVKTLYPTNQDQAFYTSLGGKHQKLNNGNRLITETFASRIFEVTPEGETVWEWVQQPFDETYVPKVHEGTRYSIEEIEIDKWKKAHSNLD